jgi:hypothetical protein
VESRERRDTNAGSIETPHAIALSPRVDSRRYVRRAEAAYPIVAGSRRDNKKITAERIATDKLQCYEELQHGFNLGLIVAFSSGEKFASVFSDSFRLSEPPKKGRKP